MLLAIWLQTGATYNSAWLHSTACFTPHVCTAWQCQEFWQLITLRSPVFVCSGRCMCPRQSCLLGFPPF